MSGSRNERSFAPYEGSFINVELKGLVSYLKVLKKNEKDKEAAAFLSNAKKIIEWIDWFLDYFKYGNVPGMLKWAYIGAQLLFLKPKITAIVNQYKVNYINCDKINRNDLPLDRAYLLVILRLMQILERSPASFEQVFPFLNMEELIKEIDSHFGNDKDKGKVFQEKPSQSGLDKSKESEILKLFPALFSIFNDSKKLKKADKKTKVSISTNIFIKICDLFLPIINHVPDLIPIYSTHKQASSTKDSAELGNQIKQSLEIVDKEIRYFQEFRKTLHYKGLIQHTHISEGLLFFYKCLLKAQVRMLGISEIQILEDVVANDSVSKIFLRLKESHLGYGMWKIKDKLKKIENQYDENHEIQSLISNLEYIHTTALIIIRSFSQGKVPHALEMLKLIYFSDEISLYVVKIQYQFEWLVRQNNKQALEEILCVNLELLAEMHDVIDTLPKNVRELLSFADIDRVLSPLFKVGFDKTKLQPLVEYVLDYKNYYPTLHELAMCYKESQVLYNVKDSVELVGRYEALIQKIEEKCLSLDEANAIRTQKLAANGQKPESDGKYYRHRFFYDCFQMINDGAKLGLVQLAQILSENVKFKELSEDQSLSPNAGFFREYDEVSEDENQKLDLLSEEVDPIIVELGDSSSSSESSHDLTGDDVFDHLDILENLMVDGDLLSSMIREQYEIALHIEEAEKDLIPAHKIAENTEGLNLQQSKMTHINEGVMFNRINEVKPTLLGVIQDSQRNDADIYSKIMVDNSSSKTLARAFWNMIAYYEDFFNGSGELAESLFVSRIQKLLVQLNESGCLTVKSQELHRFEFVQLCKPELEMIKHHYNALNDSSISFEFLDAFIASVDPSQSNEVVGAPQITVIQEKKLPEMQPLEVEEVNEERPAQVPAVKAKLFSKEMNGEIIPAPIVVVMERQEKVHQTINKLNVDFHIDTFLRLEYENEQIKIQIDRLANTYEIQNRTSLESLKDKIFVIKNNIVELTEKLDRDNQVLRGLESQKLKTENRKKEFGQFIESFNKIVKAFAANPKQLFIELNKHIKVDKLYGFTGEAWVHDAWSDKTFNDLRQSFENGLKQFGESLRMLQNDVTQKKEVNAELDKNLTTYDALLGKLNEEMDSLSKYRTELANKFDDLNKVHLSLKQHLLVLKKIHVIPAQIEEWKTLLNDYFDERNAKYYWRDVTESVGVGFIGMFGSKKQTQYQKRKDFLEKKLNPALDQYAIDGDEKALSAVLEEGNQFRSRVNEASIRFDSTLKGQIQQIKSDLAKTSSPIFKQ